MQMSSAKWVKVECGPAWVGGVSEFQYLFMSISGNGNVSGMLKARRRESYVGEEMIKLKQQA